MSALDDVIENKKKDEEEKEEDKDEEEKKDEDGLQTLMELIDKWMKSKNEKAKEKRFVEVE